MRLSLCAGETGTLHTSSWQKARRSSPYCLPRRTVRGAWKSTKGGHLDTRPSGCSTGGAGRTLKVYIRGLPHLTILEDVFAVQAWLSGTCLTCGKEEDANPTHAAGYEGADGHEFETKFSIEYSTKAGEVLTEYTDEELWLEILRRLEKLDWWARAHSPKDGRGR